MSNDEIINSIYHSLFNRDAEPEGLAYFADRLENGTLNTSNIAIAILDGAQETDLTNLTAKIAAADLFTQSLDTPEEIAAYNGSAATVEIRAYLATVSADHPGTATDINGFISDLLLQSPSDPTSPSEPSPLAFTVGVDHFTATDASEVYTATLGTDATLNSGDSLVGMGNKLELTDADTGAVQMPGSITLSGVSELSFTTEGNAGTLGTFFYTAGVGGLTKFTLDAHGTAGDFIYANANIDVTATSVSTTFGVDGAGSVDITDSALSNLYLLHTVDGGVTLHDVASSSLNVVAIEATITGGLDLSDTDVTSLTISGSSASTIDAISSDALTSLTVTGNVLLGSSASFFTLGNSVTSLDMSGVVTLSGSGTDYVRVTAANASLDVGNAHIFLNLNNTSGATVTVGADGDYAGSIVPGVLLTNAVAGVSLSMAGAAGLVHDTSSNTTSELLANAAAHAGSAYWAVIGANTYFVESDTGTLGSGDTTFVGINGHHSASLQGGHIFVA